MLSKKVVKDIQSLGLKKHRQETHLFIAEGPKVVRELLANKPAQIEMIYATESWALQNNFEKITVVTGDELQKISALQTPNEVLAVVQQDHHPEPDGKAFTIYLDAIQDPGNLGTIIRTADWFGVVNMVCGNGCADLYNPKVVQATMGSISRVNVYYDVENNWLHQKQVPVYAAALAGQNLHSFSKITAGILLIGNESKGLRQELLALANYKITVPGKGLAESLNAAVATGVILSHLLA